MESDWLDNIYFGVDLSCVFCSAPISFMSCVAHKSRAGSGVGFWIKLVPDQLPSKHHASDPVMSILESLIVNSMFQCVSNLHSLLYRFGLCIF